MLVLLDPLKGVVRIGSQQVVVEPDLHVVIDGQGDDNVPVFRAFNRRRDVGDRVVRAHTLAQVEEVCLGCGGNSAIEEERVQLDAGPLIVSRTA